MLLKLTPSSRWQQCIGNPFFSLSYKPLNFLFPHLELNGALEFPSWQKLRNNSSFIWKAICLMMMKDFSRQKKSSFQKPTRRCCATVPSIRGYRSCERPRGHRCSEQTSTRGPYWRKNRHRNGMNHEWRDEFVSDTWLTISFPDKFSTCARLGKWPQLRTPLAVQPEKRSDQKCVQQWKTCTETGFLFKIDEWNFFDVASKKWFL